MGVTKLVNKLKPSKRGELEIVDILNMYIKENRLKNFSLGRGYAWFDTGTNESMLEASNFVKSIETLQKFQIGNIHEVALKNNWISKKKFIKLTKVFEKSGYGEYLKTIT